MRLKTLAALTAVACLCLFAPGLGQAADFTADMTQTVNGKPLLQGKASVKSDGKVRMESTMQGMSQVVISDPVTGRMVMLQPQTKLYMETRVDPAKMSPDVVKDGQSKLGQWRVVGRETVGGWECEKRTFDFKDKGQGDLTGWFALKLDYPIKTVFTNGKDTMSVEYKNIKAAPLDASLFEVPAGFQRMNVPAGAGPGQGMAPGNTPGK